MPRDGFVDLLFIFNPFRIVSLLNYVIYGFHIWLITFNPFRVRGSKKHSFIAESRTPTEHINYALSTVNSQLSFLHYELSIFFCISVCFKRISEVCTLHSSLRKRILVLCTVHSSLQKRISVLCTLHSCLRKRISVLCTLHSCLRKRISEVCTLHSSLRKRIL